MIAGIPLGVLFAAWGGGACVALFIGMFVAGWRRWGDEETGAVVFACALWPLWPLGLVLFCVVYAYRMAYVFGEWIAKGGLTPMRVMVEGWMSKKSEGSE